ncbi:MAG: alanine racemase, partial [Erysipelotrichales bacterium]
MNNYYRDSYLEINVDTMLSNLKEIKEKCSSDKFLYAVIKGNGYGHGIIEMATMAQASKADGLAVATLDEALIVRKYIKDMKILCLGIIREQDYLIAAQHDITLTIANSTSIEHILNCNLVKDIKVHIKVNTGMNRIGFKEISEIEDAIEQLSTNDKIEIEGIFTHFATADGEQLREYFDMQFAKFKETIENLSYDFKHIHCSNSGTLLKHYDKMDFCTATRVGIAMYGGLEDEALNNFDVKAGLRLI